MKPYYLLFILFFTLSGCKKDQSGTAITAKTLLGRWHMVFYSQKYNEEGKPAHDLPITLENLDFEYVPGGRVNRIFLDAGFSSPGDYTIGYEGGKYVYSSNVAGLAGAPDYGKGVIELPDRKTIRITFTHTLQINFGVPVTYVFVEELKKL